MDNNPSPDVAKKGVKTFSCPACGGVITLRNAGQSLIAVCSYCSSVIDVANENYQIIIKAEVKELETLLAIGAKGTLFDTVWEVIGYMRKGSGGYGWDEYLLFNPYSGYRFLVQAEGHWNFVTMTKEKITGDSEEGYQSEGQKYKIFLKDTSIVQYVKGEFYWRVKRGDRVKEVDYISPPYMLTIEDSSEDEVVSKGLYVEPSVVQKAFNLDTLRMPRRKGVAANQPSAYQNIWSILLVGALGFILAIYIHKHTSANSANEVLYNNNSVYTKAQKDLTFSTPVFRVSKKSNILITTYSSVDNNWTEVSYALVRDDGNNATMQTPASPVETTIPVINAQPAYEMSTSVEYYYGYDSDGGWSEGGQVSNDYIASSVPPGNYRLLYDIDSGAFAREGQVKMFFTVTRDVSSQGNFWWTVLLLLFYPAYALMRYNSFERARWSQSDFSPYASDDE